MDLSYAIVSHLLIRILGTEPNHSARRLRQNFPVVSHFLIRILGENRIIVQEDYDKTFQIILFLFLIFLFSYMERELNHSTGRLQENIPTTVVSHSHITEIIGDKTK